MQKHKYEVIESSRDRIVLCKVEVQRVEEIRIEIKGLDEENRLIENIPEKDCEVIATVYVKKPDGTIVVAAKTVAVEFSVIDPAPANTDKVDSFEYSTGKYLGKANDLSAVFWKKHADCNASSSTSNKTSCIVNTIVNANSSDLGKAKIYFKPSNVGGDTFKIKATVYASDDTTVLKTVESDFFTIWRKVELTAYEMHNCRHVSRHGTEKKMASYYTDDTYVRYIKGTIHTIDQPYSVKYFGLWDHSTQSQRWWPTEKRKNKDNGEIPDDEETRIANGPPGPDRDEARKNIKEKAEKWKDRILKNFASALIHWPFDAGVELKSIIAVNYCHPKYDYQSPKADAITDEWSAYPWLQIDYNGNLIHPDSRWNTAQSFEYFSFIFILKGMSAARYEIAIAHEIGHIAKNQFKKDVFGNSDHSTSAGLMDPMGSLASFTEREKKILRGIKP
jgi:hypothetical protein